MMARPTAISALLLTLSVITRCHSQETAEPLWSLAPLKQPQLPEVGFRDWPANRIDFFVLARLEALGLRPASPADRSTLWRRASIDLVGLPPEAAELATQARKSRDYEAWIDRLLSSPHYGERWGRHWLDLARYTDTTAKWLKSTGGAYRYRDWVVSALNQDLGYDQFVTRQLANDMLPAHDPRDNAALGFLGLSPTYWKELKLAPSVIRTIVAAEWEERIDAVSRTFLGLTVACARCHDHKFDPITMQDYYGLAGVFASIQLADRPLLPAPHAEKVMVAKLRVSEIDSKLTELRKNPKNQEKVTELEKEKEQLRQQTEHFDAPMVSAVREASLFVRADGPDRTRLDYQPELPRDIRVQLRGNPDKPGSAVPRGFLSATGRPRRIFTEGSGRRELAEAITQDARVLTARVVVNRVWMHHFGRGLVNTPSDFGTQGERPSHPDLLDDLASRFLEHDWSLKWLHREIMLSATYQQSALGPSSATDPDNQLLGFIPARRVDIEVWRDTMLTIAGSLDRRLGGEPSDLSDPANNRRTIYATVKRRELSRLLRMFDFPDPTHHSPRRRPTTTPLQQLAILNGPFVRTQAERLARRVRYSGDIERDVTELYHLAYARPPRPEELSLALAFLRRAQPGADTQPSRRWISFAQVLLSSNELFFVD